MKIIGTAVDTYLCEVTKSEMKRMTGREEPWGPDCHAHKPGTVVNIIPISDHAEQMERTIKQRKNAAETLRSVANIIETIPEVFVAATQQPDARSAAQDLRDALT